MRFMSDEAPTLETHSILVIWPRITRNERLCGFRTLCWTGSVINYCLGALNLFNSTQKSSFYIETKKIKVWWAHQWCPFYTAPCSSDSPPLRGRNLRGRSCWAKWSRSRRNPGSSSCPPAPRRRRRGWGGRSRWPESWAPRRGRRPPPPSTGPIADGRRRWASACWTPWSFARRRWGRGGWRGCQSRSRLCRRPFPHRTGAPCDRTLKMQTRIENRSAVNPALVAISYSTQARWQEISKQWSCMQICL